MMNQYLVFHVFNQSFSISIDYVNRILPAEKITPIPDTASYILGVIENEQTILPIIDLSNRFFGQSHSDKENEQIIVVIWNDIEIGLLVEKIDEIMSFETIQIDTELEKITALEKPRQITPIQSFIKAEKEIILELNINELFDTQGSLQIQELITDYI